ncbi:MAG: WecB/TagA/CpsF family glycosyltransferase, partial [Candidatus Omnitrophica bacterium]|nr:WecB/TagA/CpsF family glycosyltransferase [Candidatus Omnitrophota bacterium]
MSEIRRINILGVAIDNVNSQEAIGVIRRSILSKRCNIVVTPNVDHIMQLQKDSELRRIYDEALLVLPDGAPILWAARVRGRTFKEKVSGADIFPKICQEAALYDFKVFLLGGRPNAAAKTAEVLKGDIPSLQIVGIYSPPYGFENDSRENQKIIQMIKTAAPDILFVGLGTPKQEKWIYANCKDYYVPISMGVGASFEFYSGIIRRAPLWMQQKGLEWFWRLIQEPRRLWKRYLVDDWKFFILVLKQRILQRN